MTIQVREAASDTDPASWLDAVSVRLVPAERDLLARGLRLALEHYPGHLCPDGEPLLPHCREVADILVDLRMDAETVVAGLLSGLPLVGSGYQEALREVLGPTVSQLVDGVGRMAQIQSLRGKVASGSPTADRVSQLDSLRKMLLAMVQDVRVVLIKLADQTQTLRYLAGRGDDQARNDAARDTFDLFAPLANRLGVWQLKWELEDLAFRCSSPDTYRSIARELDEKRSGREAFILQVLDILRTQLTQAGIQGEVTGRSKHIYSIYNKLLRKDRTLKELFDIRGVRVLVNDVKDCYAVLGLVHNLWTPLPKEFDDYIAKPKPNGYRSLHTAVVGPDGKVLEVQIRTYEMHQQCEYGVAAHWRYKEQAGRHGARARESARAEAAFDDKIAWLRQILDWRDGLTNVADFAEDFRTGMFEDTVYVLTPQGRVIDLPRGSTPVDFAYHVHSELGHRCRGAKVDGDMVPLNTPLTNGQTVDILAAKTGGPSRDWLNPELGYIHSARARAKVRQWFNSQNLEAAIGQGRQIVEKLLQRAGMTSFALDRLAGQLGFDKVDDLLVAVGRSELSSRQIQTAIRDSSRPDAPQGSSPVEAALPVNKSAAPAKGSVLVVGVDKLLTVLAKCCKPAPPDPIVGFVTRGRGVTVHRRQCANLANLSQERLIEAQWGADAAKGVFPVDIEVDATSRPELMRDVLDVFTREKVRVSAAHSQAREPDARLLATLEVAGLDQLRRLLALLRELPGVTGARRL